MMVNVEFEFGMVFGQLGEAVAPNEPREEENSERQGLTERWPSKGLVLRVK
jgi:hypothetical protein